MTSEQFCLKRNDFQQNIASSYQELRGNQDFSDVTLVCEEDQLFEAHRIILSNSSQFFSSLLKKNKHSHIMSSYNIEYCNFVSRTTQGLQKHKQQVHK